ncbi:DUF3040 domain-containing protein [Buchananella hordeovulneris]|uniref:DUF3040 domain-containing protein n=1 Tax=Buchananella hordeovulneris TaxID=52770 RepID=A0A1Q5PVE3_9ACTO|nr:DUF3040 domain-containing protein [Buchananella hordeovulneris]MDO5080580.1 DUF3040 domain-containing protein [Buchananella hordeovulneris]OKL51537.1 hypothetical protein BSZ40_06740 [Buchananella hordeovulneris]
MGLSEREREVLAQLEAQMRGEDPGAAAPTGPASPSSLRPVSGGAAGGFSFTRVVVGVAGTFVGMAILVGAVAFRLATVPAVTLGVLGFLVALAGVVYAISQPRGGRKWAAGRRPRGGGKQGSFMQRQQEQWDKRRRSRE